MPDLSTLSVYACSIFRRPLLFGFLGGFLCLSQILVLSPEPLNAASSDIPVVAVEQNSGEMYKILEGFGSKSASQTTPYQTARAATNHHDAQPNETDSTSQKLRGTTRSRSHSLSFLESPEQTPAQPIGTTKFYGETPSKATAPNYASRGSNSQTRPITPKNTASSSTTASNTLKMPQKLNPPARLSRSGSGSNALSTARYNSSDRNEESMRIANYSEEMEENPNGVDMRPLVHGGTAQFGVDPSDEEEDYEEEQFLRPQTAAHPPQAPSLSRRQSPEPPLEHSVQHSALSNLDADLMSDLALTPSPHSHQIPSHPTTSQVNPMFASNAAEMSETADVDAESEQGNSILDKAFPAMGEKSGSKLSLLSGDSNLTPVVNVMGCLCVVLGVFFAFALFMKKVSPKTGKRIPREALENVGQFALNPKMQLNLLRLGNRLILVATTQDGVVETLTEINNQDEVSQILGICHKIDPNSSQSQFQSVLEEMSQEKAPPGFFGTAEMKSRTSGEPSLSSLLSSGLQDRGTTDGRPKRKSGVYG